MRSVSVWDVRSRNIYASILSTVAAHFVPMVWYGMLKAAVMPAMAAFTGFHAVTFNQSLSCAGNASQRTVNMIVIEVLIKRIKLYT